MQLIASIRLEDKIPGSKYFTWAEALWLPSMQAYALPDSTQQVNIIKTAQALDKVREHFARPIRVHCWLRPTPYNKFVGGVPASFHVRGLAVDFDVQGIDCESAKKEIRAQGAKLWPGRGEIDTTNWVHLDLGAGSWFYAKARNSP